MKLLKTIKTFFKTLLVILLALVLVVGAYIAYVFISYHRVEDYLTLKTSGSASESLEAGNEITVISYNIGFCAYTADFGFFMDGGTQSRAASSESVNSVLSVITQLLKEENADIILLEEVDLDSDRSYHINECEKLVENLSFGKDYVFAENYDSAYLFYPITCPHGASNSGMLTLSSYPITSSVRRSLPIEEGIMKLVDLDRAYSVSRISVGEKELVLYTTHLSAYSSDGSIANRQLEMLLADMQSEYEKGNYAICGGDFNKDIVGKGSEVFGVENSDYTWAQPIPDSVFEGKNLTVVAPFDEENPVPSCRNADGPYNPSQYVITPDGFIVSDNVTVVSSSVIDTEFAYSDHNPVKMTFILD